jgi:type IX secretion system PorP/SprF family membrane protein
MRLKDKHGVGINYTNDRYSIWYTNKVSANYNYQMELGENSKLSVGAAASLNDFRTDYGKMTFSVPMEPEYRVTDINANLGVAYTWKKLLVHGSATNIFNSVLNSDDVASNFFDLRTFHIGAAYDFSLGERFSLKPQLLSQFTDGFIGLYLNTQFAFKDKYWIGATVGARDNYAFIAGWNVKEKFRVAYSYDRTISKLNNGFSAGSHEFSLGFYLK